VARSDVSTTGVTTQRKRHCPRFSSGNSQAVRIPKKYQPDADEVEITRRGDTGTHYGRLRSELEKRGSPIGAYDLLIAAHAIALRLILVTNNVREFRRVSGLRLENWVQ
jgi:predicted nucleic acid-binding protein